MHALMRTVAVIALCLAVLAGPLDSPCAARGQGSRPKLVFSTFPSDGMGVLFRQILVEAYGRIGYDVEVRKAPAERGLVLANQGHCDGMDARAPVVEESCPNLVRVPTALYVNTVVAYSKKTDIDPARGWDVLAPYRVGSLLGYKFVEKKTSAYDRVLVSCYGQLFAMLENDRLDVAVVAYLDALPSLRDVNLGGIRMLSPPLASTPMYHYLHKKHADLVPAIDSVLRRMRDEGRLDALLEEAVAVFKTMHVIPCKTSLPQ